ncbi:uncharacterized protein LOC143199403 [Rhynchophorus ferrugineus]|uniref:Secreted protein n=1 Tax=Rhynchophorus ferrugineus TaxID=354439 RepID=A0A834I6V4_RHYFE|nr:hypothetical protein GWI33_014089 [Rhynchophorus ferrugineus]
MASVINLPLFYLLFVFGFTSINGQSQEVSQLENYFYRTCLKYSGSTEPFNKLRADFYEMYEYFKVSSQLLPVRKKDFCKDDVPRLITRIKNVETDMKACLPHNDTSQAVFIKESLIEFLRFLCDKVQTRLFSSEVTMCREKIESSPSQELDYCLNRIFPPTNGLLTKKDLCDDLSIARKCVALLLEQQCPSSQLTKDLNQEFFSHLEKPCNGCGYLSLNISSLILLLLVHFLK